MRIRELSLIYLSYGLNFLKTIKFKQGEHYIVCWIFLRRNNNKEKYLLQLELPWISHNNFNKLNIHNSD